MKMHLAMANVQSSSDDEMQGNDVGQTSGKLNEKNENEAGFRSDSEFHPVTD